jgi:arylsulfatase A-like enzyme
MMALGAGIAKGATDTPIGHVDVAATAAEMLGFRAAEEIAGKPIRELL